MLIALGLSMAILLGFQFFYERPRQQAEHARQAAQLAKQVTAQPQMATAIEPVPQTAERQVVIHESKRISIQTPRLQGSLNLRGARLDDLVLLNYPEKVGDSKPVTLLSPTQTATPYFVDFSWLANDGEIKLPDAQTIWQADAAELTPDHPVTLHWDNGKGLRFEQVLKIDTQYLFTVTLRIINSSKQTVEVFPIGRVRRPYQPALTNAANGQTNHTAFILHEGPIGYVGGQLYQPSYDALSEEKAPQQIMTASGNGWLGITDKYWLVALVPDQASAIDGRFVRDGVKTKTGSFLGSKVVDDKRNFQADFRAPAQTVEAGKTVEYTSHLFAGAKEMPLLDGYEKSHNIPRFDLAVDFGWFYIITKPFYYVLSWLGKIVGNFGVAIILFTLMVRGVMLPVALKSQRSMQKMKEVQPKLKEIQAKYKADPAQLQQHMMALYKEEGINPASGCLPMFLQIPIFFALYKVLYITIEMRHAPFIGYLHDLSAPDPTNIFNVFGLVPWTPPAFLQIGLLPFIMGLTMWLQFKTTGTMAGRDGGKEISETDKIQKEMATFMPWLMTLVFAHMPAGLVLYWTVSNMLGFAQQLYIKATTHKKG